MLRYNLEAVQQTIICKETDIGVDFGRQVVDVCTEQKGPSTVPCATLEVTGAELDDLPSTTPSGFCQTGTFLSIERLFL